MDDSHIRQPLTVVDLSQTDLFLALHYGLKVPKELLSPWLDVKPADLETVVRVGRASELLPSFQQTLQAAEPELPSDAAAPPADAEFLEVLAVAALEKFRRFTATPEQRIELAQAYKFSYDELTNYAIRADLLRLESMNPFQAELLALAGVIGVHDLASGSAHMAEVERTVLEKLLHQMRGKAAKSSGRDLAGEQPPEELEELTIEALRALFQEALDRIPEADPRKVQLEQWLSILPPQQLELLIEEASRSRRNHAPQLVAATEVVVVVKGAGLQKPDETLDTFINGFWPAVKNLDPAATIKQRQSVLPPEYPAPDGEEEYNRLTEIQSGERRIWLKEAHWEAALSPLSPITALWYEWRMATYAFGSLLYDLASPNDTADYYRKPDAATWKAMSPAQKAADAEALKVEHRKDFHRLFFAHFWQYMLYFALLSWGVWGHFQIRANNPNAPSLPAVLGLLLLGSFVLAVLIGLITAYRVRRIKQQKPLGRLTTKLSTLLTLLVLLGALFINPLRYVLTLVVLMLFQTLVLLVRDIAWPYRERFNSDTKLSEFYFRQREESDGNLSCDTSRVFRRENQRRKYLISAALYRFIVVLGIPLVFIVHIVTLFLRFVGRAIPAVGDIGVTIESVVSNLLSGGLGDVAGYSNDPAQAHRFRSVIQRDIEFFHRQPQVNHIHVFAHSQGTPITFETLFHYLPDFFRTKIKSYVTIGSVLSYYHQAGPVLDTLYVRRFPIIPYPHFAKGFRWINFWNSNDPITEFFALDEFDLYEAPQTAPIAQEGKPPYTYLEACDDIKPVRSSRSPTNIRTVGHPVLNLSHSEYWHNLREVQIPLALRVLGSDNPEAWQLLTDEEWQRVRAVPRVEFPGIRQSHFRFVILLIGITWALLVATLFFVGRLIASIVAAENTIPWLQWLPDRQFFTIPYIHRALPFMPDEFVAVLVLLVLFAVIGSLRPLMATWLQKLLFQNPSRPTPEARSVAPQPQGEPVRQWLP
jgi:pimeloyl-ACP methyl ester carboxylesterase